MSVPGDLAVSALDKDSRLIGLGSRFDRSLYYVLGQDT